MGAIKLRWFLLFAAIAVGCNPPSKPVASSRSASSQTDANAFAVANQEQEAKLEAKITLLKFNVLPFDQAIARVRSASGANIVVDWPALERISVLPNSPVTANLHDIKAKKALEIIFMTVQSEDENLHLYLWVDRGAVQVSSLDGLKKTVFEVQYPVGDILSVEPSKGTPAQMRAALAERRDELEQFITDNVDTVSWHGNGGDIGTIRYAPAGDVLVIAQTRDGHRKVRAALGGLRESERHPALPVVQAPETTPTGKSSFHYFF